MTRKKTILLVEDNEFLSRIIHKKLTVKGYNVVKALNAEAGLDCLKKKKPDLIWLDYYLPGMNGEEFIKIVKQDPKYENIPIILVTCSQSHFDVTHTHGADAYFLKSNHDLNSIVKAFEKFLK